MSAVSAAASAHVDHHHLLDARQMQTLSFAAHIALVAFGISVRATVLFVEWLHMRTGDELYLTIVRRWTRPAVPSAGLLCQLTLSGRLQGGEPAAPPSRPRGSDTSARRPLGATRW